MVQRTMLYSGPQIYTRISRVSKNNSPKGGGIMKSNRGSSLLAVLCFLLTAATALAQTTISTIEGTIKDAQGSVVSGAQVVVKSQSLGIERTATSDADGFYRVTALPAGNYSITISHTGFATRTFDNVELTLNRTLTLDIPLEVGAVQEQVDVVENAQLLNPTSASTGSTITPQQIKEMPTNGRNYLDLMQLVPGVVINRQANVGSDNSTPVLGERSGNNNFLIDGQPNKDTVIGGAASQFNQETIAEFQVLTAGFRAEFGQASGAIVNVITKSGGNEFHGLASIFFRNNVFRFIQFTRSERNRSSISATLGLQPRVGRSDR